jgi:hypothetical protein
VKHRIDCLCTASMENPKELGLLTCEVSPMKPTSPELEDSQGCIDLLSLISWHLIICTD